MKTSACAKNNLLMPCLMTAALLTASIAQAASFRGKGYREDPAMVIERNEVGRAKCDRDIDRAESYATIKREDCYKNADREWTFRDRGPRKLVAAPLATPSVSNLNPWI